MAKVNGLNGRGVSISQIATKGRAFCTVISNEKSGCTIPSNIAEGQSRNSVKEFLLFIAIAKGSNSELETQLLICSRVGYMNNQEMQVAFSLITEIAKMLSSLSKTLETRNLKLETQVNGVNEQ